MARLFATSIDLNKNELQNARIQNLSSNPSSPVAGQIYFNTTDNELRYYDGIQWVSGSSVEFGNTASRPAASKAGQLYVDTEDTVIYVDNGSSWVKGTVSPEDVAGWISDHNDLTTGVHGVTGDVVGTSDTQTLTNKTITDSLKFSDGGNWSAIYSDVNDLRIDGSNDIKLTTNTGDIVLDPDGSAYIGSVQADNEITTAASTQTFTNKTVGDVLNFTNPSTTPVDGEIYVDDNTEEFVIKANTENLILESYNGDIKLNADGSVYVNSQLHVNGNLNTTNIVGENADGADGSLTLKDADQSSQIHINGATKNIELLPVSGSKAYYGSSATAGNEIAKISDIQASESGLGWKQAVNLLSTSNIDLGAITLRIDLVGTVIDGHSALTTADAGYRLLLTGQSSTDEYGANGIYELYVEAGALYARRPTDADAYSELVGSAVFVMEGNQYGATSWVQANHYLTDFTNQEWVQFSGQGTYIGSDSIQIDGNQINVIVDINHGLDIDGDGLLVNLAEVSGLYFPSGALAIDVGTGLTVNGSNKLTFDSGYGVRKYIDTIGDDSATSFNLDHNFDTRYVTVQIFEAASPHAQIEADVEHSTTNRVVVRFASAPTTGQYEVVIVG